MPIILPLIAFVLVFLDLLGLQARRPDPPAGLRLALLEAAAFLAAYMLVFAEILSLFRLLTGPWAALCWGLAGVAAGLVGWRTGLLARGVHSLRSSWQKPDRFDVAAGAVLAVILLLLLVTALVSPPNNNDSLQYHMSRVMHWVQDQGLEYYATGYEPQVYLQTGAELAILNAHLLWGTDRLANVVQWGSLIGILAGVSFLAKLLGGGKKAQWLAIAFVASLPMALLQATSTQNDLVTALWVVSLLVFVVQASKRVLHGEELLALAVVFGLGLATKGTFYPYAVPPLLYFIVIEFKRHKPGRVILHGLFIVAIAIMLNLGIWGRNWVTFRSPLGPSAFIENKTVVLAHPGSAVGSIVRTIAVNLATPSERLNGLIDDELHLAFHSIDPLMAQFKLIWGWNQEDEAGNPLHLLLILATLALLVIFRRRIDLPTFWPYLVVAIGLFLMLAIVVNTGTFEGRYQLPFFVAWAPLFGIAVGATIRKRLPSAAVLLLLLATFPWVLFNRTRPLIAMRPSHDPFTIPCLAGCTSGSILNEPPVRVLFAAWTDLQGPYSDATGAIRQSACKSVGLKLDSHDLEYTFWWLLNAPQSGIRLETIYTLPELERYIDPTFKPCAILCTICRGQTRLDGLPLVSDYTGFVQLYMGPDYSPDTGK